MKTSEQIDKIAPALVKAQAAILFAKKDTTNPHFKSTFAGLPSVIDAVKPALNENGIAFIQTPSPSDDGRLHLTTRLLHVSGQWIEDTAVCPLPKADPQGFGSASTYLRRYSLAAITGLYQDDDDGEGATRGGEPETTAKTAPLGKPVTTVSKITAASLKTLEGFRKSEAGEKAYNELLKVWKLTDYAAVSESEAKEAIAWISGEVAATASKAVK